MPPDKDNPGSPGTPVRITSNPLRLGEPGFVSAIPCAPITQRFVHVKTILEDIGRLVDMINAEADPYNKRLLGKFMVLEFVSFRENVRQLYNAINQEKDLTPVDRDPKKAFQRVISMHPLFDQVRDRIAAHRDFSIPMDAAIQMWDSMTAESLNELLTASHDLFNAIYRANALIFRPYCLEAATLRGVLGVEVTGERKSFSGS